MKSSRSIKYKRLEHRLKTKINHSGNSIKMSSELSKLKNDVFDLIYEAYGDEVSNIHMVRAYLLYILKNTEDSQSLKEFYSRKCLASATKVSTWESIKELIYLMLEKKSQSTK